MTSMPRLLIGFAPVLLFPTFVSLAMAEGAPATHPSTRPTARQLVEQIKAQIGVPWSAATVDTFKAGDPDTEVTGIATTHLDTLDVLKRAAASGKNFVITHEPTFYNHLDQITPALQGDPVLAEKKAFVEQHHMVVFRFHDHWHRRQPDGINEGVIAKLDWGKYVRPGPAGFFEIPPTSLDALAGALKTRLGATVVRVVGLPQQKFTKLAMLPGAAGSAAQIKVLQQPEVEVLLIGETPEWETVEYVRDAISEGRAKALILLGHANSEEAGMDNCAKWLATFLAGMPIEFMPAGDPFWRPTESPAAKRAK